MLGFLQNHGGKRNLTKALDERRIRKRREGLVQTGWIRFGAVNILKIREDFVMNLKRIAGYKFYLVSATLVFAIRLPLKVGLGNLL